MSKIFENISAIINGALDFALPRYCVCCGKMNPDGSYKHICTRCALNIKPMSGARCLVCSEIVGDENDRDVVGCPYCMNSRPRFNRSMASVSFSGVPRKLVLALKYRNGVEYLDDIATFMRDTRGLDEFLLDAILVPVPLHYTRRFSRAYNQSELIAKSLLKAFPKSNCIIANMLTRVKHTSSQTALDRTERARNIEGAFEYRKTIPIAHASRIVIVDDVMTTTATLSECANTFKKNGFPNIDAYAFARRL